MTPTPDELRAELETRRYEPLWVYALTFVAVAVGCLLLVPALLFSLLEAVGL